MLVNIEHESMPAPSQPKPATPLKVSQYASTAPAPCAAAAAVSYTHLTLPTNREV